ncbi:gluconate 2-dehydrogenase subunit 3 family protein [Rudanella paleaurantiibacter]|nr:gluconate 2-dehydrogenase subunit 3 family protein [Rudanella paleaurantiibacter]
MQRRSALKHVALAVGGLMNLPAWASGWTPESIGTSSLLSVTNDALLAEITETIIPETTTPGAKSLKVDQFVQRMIQDCYGEAAKNTLKQGLVLVDQVAQQAFSKPFVNGDPTQRLEVLTQMANSTDPTAKQFVNLVKGLTIQGFRNSEYYMVNQLKFNMAPGFYHGCVTLKS